MRTGYLRAALLLAACLLVIAGCTSSVSSTIDRERGDTAYYMQKDYNAAYRYYSAAAANGDVDSQWQLSQMMFSGKGIPQDEAGGMIWLQKAANGGHPKAQTKLGLYYMQGSHGLGRDYNRALSLLIMAANQDEGPACLALGMMYGSGMGMDKNPYLAAQWFGKARELGYPVPNTMTNAATIAQATPPKQRHTPRHKTSHSVSRQMVLEVQQGLTDLGYSPGPIDGLFGAKTARAIKAFQQVYGLTADGKISQTLITEIRAKLSSQQ